MQYFAHSDLTKKCSKHTKTTDKFPKSKQKMKTYKNSLLVRFFIFMILI